MLINKVKKTVEIKINIKLTAFKKNCTAHKKYFSFNFL
jgi:hypothetical protein